MLISLFIIGKNTCIWIYSAKFPVYMAVCQIVISFNSIQVKNKNKTKGTPVSGILHLYKSKNDKFSNMLFLVWLRIGLVHLLIY